MKIDIDNTHTTVRAYIRWLFCIEDGGILHSDIMHHAFRTTRLDACLGATANDMRDVDVAEIRQEQVLFWLVFLAGISSNVIIEISRFENDSLILDIVHEDIRYEDTFSLTSSSHSTFEAESGIGTTERIVAHHDVSHAT